MAFTAWRERATAEGEREDEAGVLRGGGKREEGDNDADIVDVVTTSRADTLLLSPTDRGGRVNTAVKGGGGKTDEEEETGGTVDVVVTSTFSSATGEGGGENSGVVERTGHTAVVVVTSRSSSPLSDRRRRGETARLRREQAAR